MDQQNGFWRHTKGRCFVSAAPLQLVNTHRRFDNRFTPDVLPCATWRKLQNQYTDHQDTTAPNKKGNKHNLPWQWILKVHVYFWMFSQIIVGLCLYMKHHTKVLVYEFVLGIPTRGRRFPLNTKHFSLDQRFKAFTNITDESATADWTGMKPK